MCVRVKARVRARPSVCVRVKAREPLLVLSLLLLRCFPADFLSRDVEYQPLSVSEGVVKEELGGAVGPWALEGAGPLGLEAEGASGETCVRKV